MQLDIQHSEETAGSARKTSHYFLTATVHLSEAEKHIIQARNLTRIPVISGASAPPAGLAKAISPGLGGFGPLIMLCSFVWGVFGGGNGAGLTFIIGLGLWIWLYIGPMVIDKKHGIHDYTLGSLLTNPTIRLISDDPVGTKVYEQELQENLTKAKQYIDAAQDIGARKSIEI